MLGHLGLINDNFNSEMNNISYLLISSKLVFPEASKQLPVQQTNAYSNSTIETVSGVFLVKPEHRVFLLLALKK